MLVAGSTEIEVVPRQLASEPARGPSRNRLGALPTLAAERLAAAAPADLDVAARMMEVTRLDVAVVAASIRRVVEKLLAVSDTRAENAVGEVVEDVKRAAVRDLHLALAGVADGHDGRLIRGAADIRRRLYLVGARRRIVRDRVIEIGGI